MRYLFAAVLAVMLSLPVAAPDFKKGKGQRDILAEFPNPLARIEIAATDLAVRTEREDGIA